MKLAVIGVALITSVEIAAGDRSMVAIAGDPIVVTGGKLAGTQLPSGIRAYLGVPFASPPTGNLRWRAPQPSSWNGVWNADRKEAECIQVLRPHDINHYFGEEPTSEDCLYLNLWAPAEAQPISGLPVIVFIYGGGFTIGSSGMAIYDGEAIARSGAIFVNFNYRVGALGFLAHPELSREQDGHSGNYGLMDQIAALRWVRDNVGRFGGDPDKVLLVGQSAGAFSIAALLASPSASGLFRAAAMLSGCDLRREPPALREAEAIGLQLQELLGAPSLAAMRDVPADRILAAQAESQLGLRVSGARIGRPIVDGAVLPEWPRPPRVPIIASYTSADLAIGADPLLKVRSVAQFREAAAALYGEAAAEFLKLYPVRSDAEAAPVARRAATEATFGQQARQCAEIAAEAKQPAWIAEFARVHPYLPGVRLADHDPATVGAYHSGDLPYWLGTQDKFNLLRPTRGWTGSDRELSKRMRAALIAFAATGDPSTPSLRWPAWSAGAERRIVLGDGVQTLPLPAARFAWHARHPLLRQPAPPGAPRD